MLSYSLMSLCCRTSPPFPVPLPSRGPCWLMVSQRSLKHLHHNHNPSRVPHSGPSSGFVNTWWSLLSVPLLVPGLACLPTHTYLTKQVHSFTHSAVRFSARLAAAPFAHVGRLKIYLGQCLDILIRNFTRPFCPSCHLCR
ncbi:hypothetical protein XA68_17538 [Ophiocordyceps unilateralis]|uniref:Uncharacterized protein n=1 Tax=Ophiocordyceps unilateralis TaxID=268505 RepID=A0A2A9PKF6_OPHUN|nr:hypothetical protein XA68_17538 [Ophiocordyceps unilateralis]